MASQPQPHLNSLHNGDTITPRRPFYYSKLVLFITKDNANYSPGPRLCSVVAAQFKSSFSAVFILSDPRTGDVNYFVPTIGLNHRKFGKNPKIKNNNNNRHLLTFLS